MSFSFKQFNVDDTHCGMKISTDGVLLGAWAGAQVRSDAPCAILDVGTGSGLVALMMAQRFVNSSVTGVEIDNEACADAGDNFRKSPWADRLAVVEGDFSVLNFNRRFDIIVSNPPFFNSQIKSPCASRAIARHAGTLSYGTLLSVAPGLLTDDGIMAMILPESDEADMIFAAEMQRLHIVRLCRISATSKKLPSRILCELSPKCAPTVFETLVLRDDTGKASEAYRALTHDFYLKIQ